MKVEVSCFPPAEDWRFVMLAVTSGGSSALSRLSTHCRSHDPIRNANVPEDRSCSLLEGTGQVWQLCQICYDVTFEAKTACCGGKIAIAENRSAILDTVGPQLVDLRTIGSVIVDDDEHLESGADKRFQLLNMHQEAAIAFDQDDRLFRLERGAANRIGQSVTDRAEFADGKKVTGVPTVE